MSATDSNARKKLRLLYEEYRAVLILTNASLGYVRANVDSSLVAIDRMTRREINDHLPRVKRALKESRAEYGCVASRDTLLALLGELAPKSDDPRGPCYVPKYVIDTAFVRYDRALPIWNRLPPHARRSIDPDGTRIPDGAVPEVFVAEASLFEEMAMLCNEASAKPPRFSPHDPTSRQQIKRAAALQRSAVRAAFAFVEAYISGVAADILHLRPTLDTDIHDRLTEWSTKRQAPAPVSFRDKLLQYPRIALGLQHPPLQESNCPPLARVLELEGALRHALVHPNVRLDERRPAEQRETVLFRLTFESVGDVCDEVISLVKAIDAVLDGLFGDVGWWLVPRDADGRFPPETFN